MILVLVGTNPYSFVRMVSAMDDYARSSGDEVFVQLGHTDYVPKHAAYERFLQKSAVEEKIRQAEIVVTQGGFGSIADCLTAGKKIVAVPRQPELQEAPDRQEELVRELEKQGRLVAVYDIKDLPAAIAKARTCIPPSGFAHRIPTLISQFIKDNS